MGVKIALREPMNFLKGFTLILLVISIFTGAIQSTSGNPTIADSDSIWIEPSTLSFRTDELYTVGYKFNVTIMLNITTSDMYSWQAKICFDNTQLKVVSARYTAGEMSEWATHRSDGLVISIPPVINNEEGYVVLGESLTEENYVPAGLSASLAQIEFQVIEPTSFEGTLNLNNSETFVLDKELAEIPLIKYDAEYSYSRVTLVTITPDSGFAAATVVGAGFDKNSLIKIYWNETEIPTVPHKVVSDDMGEFAAVITVPTQTSPGTYNITVTDTAGNTENVSFTVIDMRGPPGPQGPQGPPGPIEYLILSLILSIIAIVMSAVALLKKK